MQVITTQRELEAVLAEFEKSDFVTVDTEFIRETTFWPILCLIQMAAPGVTALIDPLSPDIDLKPFYALMANEKVVKVFHAARQDIEIIVHQGDLVPHPIFDTQVAAMVCGFGDSVSYEQIVQKITHAQIDKSSRFTDWRHRPLTDKQLTYALADVTHLIDVYQYLVAKLARDDRAHWLNEEMAVLTARETYDPKALKDNFDLAQLLASGDAARELTEIYSPANPNNPVKIYGTNTEVAVNIKSVTFPNNRTALVRFSTDEKSATNTITRHWVSLVRFRYTGAPMRNEWRFQNPLGFQALEYRRDQETAPSPGTAEAKP